MCWSNTAFATGTRPGCATQVPSQPSVTSRSLSWRTFSSAASFAAGSFLIGICAAMPPIAGRAAPVAGLHQQQRVGAHERRGHRHLRAVGEAEILVGAEFLDAGKDVVPAPDVESRRVRAQLVEDLVHLEGGDHRFDQRRGLDAALAECPVLSGKRQRCRSRGAPRGATPSSAGRSTGPSRARAAPWRYGRSTARSRRCRRRPACRRR